MSKKNFEGIGNKAVDIFFKEEEQEKPQAIARKTPAGRPQKIKREIEKSSQEGLSENWTRYTIIIREDLLAQLKEYAWLSRKSVKEVMNEMVASYLKDKENVGSSAENE